MDTSKPRAPGSLDPTFATNGIFTFTTATYGALTINRFALGPDGTINVALMRADAGAVANFYCIGRLLSDGTPDPEFGTNGVIEGRFENDAASFGAAIALREGDRLLLSGYHLPNDGEVAARRPALVQYFTSGEIDREFGEEGFVSLDFPPPKPVEVSQNLPAGGPPDTRYEFFSFKITALPDGKILFSGVTEAQRDKPTTRYSVLGRLNADGSLDQSFGTNGWIYPKPVRNIVDQHLVRADGKILLTGQMEDVLGHRGYVACYLPDGTLDHSFGASGYAFIEGLEGGHITAVVFHGADEKLLVGANKRLDGEWSGVLSSFTRDGQPDLGFNGGQPVDIKLGSTGFKLILKDLEVDSDGVILLGEMGHIALARYRLDGSPDLAWADGDGWVEYLGLESYDLARQPDGKLVLTGMSINGEKIIARFIG